MPIERLFDHAGLMLSRDDLTSPEKVEQRRRSIAMLSPGQPALKREEALAVFDALMGYLHAGATDDRQ